MNRTNEYNFILTNTYIPQARTKKPEITKYNEIQTLKKTLEKIELRIYDTVFIKNIENKILNLQNEFHDFSNSSINNDDQHNKDVIKKQVNNEILRFRLKLRSLENCQEDGNSERFNKKNETTCINHIKNKNNDKNNNDYNKMSTFNNTHNRDAVKTENNIFKNEYKNIKNGNIENKNDDPECLNSSYDQLQEFANFQSQENIKHRKQDILNMQITELGQIMSDISLHVSLQGESLSRIDDIISKNDTVIDRTVYELDKTWRKIKNRRFTIYKFFVFWIFLILIYWYLRK
ncbi:hypothetical protein DMUE_2369 [Dictyocoela muelleri]|nr:hypothetical protein DMUE_2369 [Dictyocoela muelleri]